MKKLILIILTLFFVASTTYATQINFGETVCDSVSEPAEIDSYGFSSVANDNVLVRMSRCSGSWFPSIQVYGPDGTLLCEDTLGNPTAEIESCTLPSDGTYTILAYDTWGTGTGDYCLYLQRLNNPGNFTLISFEETHPNSISTCAEIYTYIFTAIADAKVRVRMTRTSGSWFPSIRLYGPDGTLLCEDTLGNPTAEIESCTLPSDGTYTILAYDTWGTGTGDYNLYLGCLNPPCGESVVSDFDGDGKTDIAIYRSSTGVWWVIPSSTGTPYALGFGGHSSDIAIAGDFDGDAKTDITIYRAASGVWWIRPSSTGTPYAVGFGGHSSDIPAPGDYDGDGEADIAIYRGVSGVWWIRPSSTGTPYAVGFGGHSSDIPTPCDYDGDGQADIAIYRAASGVWWIRPSSTGVPYPVGFGGHPSDIPAPGDYDGDGEADIAIYRAASGVWWIRPSSTGTPYPVGFGGHPSDIPAPGDYDGDGEADIAIYRAASGVWWIRPSSTGTPYPVGFGGHPSDMPVNPACIHLY